ncbi:MAG: DUF1697 domain-containing protein [Gemmatimonadota bacterium]|nr:DUF1697 domain-containing protein [Gemmatimonadota bacterium]
MIRYVAFLRGINLGKRRVEMARLRTLFEEMGFVDVATFIASGNVLFSAAERDASKLESRIAGGLQRAQGYDVDTFVRPLSAVAAIASSHPFPDGAESDTVHVAFLHDALDARTARSLAALRTTEDRFVVHGTEYYWSCSVRTSDSKVWTLRELKALALPSATMRNMTSVRKLVAKHQSDAE